MEREKAVGVKKRRRRGGKRGGIKHRRSDDGRSQATFEQQQNTLSLNKNAPNKTYHLNLQKMKSQLVNKFKDKSDVIAINQQISQYAQRKQLSLAIECFEKLKTNNEANKHSYAAIINAFVRCGEVQKAHETLKEMKSRRLSPCVVCYTSLLKGLCDESMEEAWSVLEEMKRAKVAANIRTVNTMLRGCLLHGEVDKALELFITMTIAGLYFKQNQNKRSNQNYENDDGDEAILKLKTKKQTKPTLSLRAGRCDADASTYEYLVCLLCHALHMEDAKQVAELRFHEHPMSQTNKKDSENIKNVETALKSSDMTVEEDDGMIDLHLARGYALTNQWRECESSLDHIDDKLSRMTSNHFVIQQSGSGGRRGAKDGQDEASQRHFSNINFRKHRQENLVRDSAILRKFCASYGSSNQGQGKSQKRKRESSSTRLEDLNQSSLRAHHNYVSGLFSRTLLFPFLSQGKVGVGKPILGHNEQKPNSQNNIKTPDTLQERIEEKLNQAMGFGRWVTSTSSSSTTSWLNAKDKSNGQLFDSKGHLRFESLFRKTPNLKTKIEFGSGTGEWCAAQAVADVGTDNGIEGSGSGGNWCAVELRADRICSTFSRACFHDDQFKSSNKKQISDDLSQNAESSVKPLENFALIQCDGHLLMSRHIAPRSLAAIFVNHPEPPQQRGGDFEQGDGASEAQHMLNSKFFLLAHQSLAQFGRLTIVTDNEWYARLLLRTAATLTAENNDEDALVKKNKSNNTNLRLFQCPDLLKPNKKQAKKMKKDGKNMSSRQGSNLTVLEALGNARIYAGPNPGMLAGHVTNSSSYFDRLWIKENKTNSSFQ